MAHYEHDGVIVRFPDEAIGLSITGLLSNSAALHTKGTPGAEAEIFSIISNSYSIRLFIKDNVVHFHRNEDHIFKEIKNVKQHFRILVSWKPDMLNIAVIVDDNYKDPDCAIAYKTNPVYVPIELLNWARRFNLLPQTVYKSPAQLLTKFVESLRQTNLIIKKENSYKLFWDRQKSTTPSIFVPKREPEVMAGISSFLQDHSLLGGYSLIRESVEIGRAHV